MTTVQDFFASTEITGALTPEQAAQLLELPNQGDTVTETEQASAPAPAPAEPEPSPDDGASNSTTKTEASEADLSADNAAILARDGKHIIPFDKLTEARDNAQRAQAERDEALRRAAELQAQLEAAKRQPSQAQATPSPESADLAALREQHYEAVQMGDKAQALELQGQIEAEVLRRAEAAMVRRMESQREQADEAKAAEEMQRVATDAKAKYPALDEAGTKADPDAIDFVVHKRDSLIAQGEPPHQALAKAVAKAAELFRWNGQQAAPQPGQRDAASAAAAAIAAARAPTPATLSDIPGGKPGGQSLESRMDTMNGQELIEMMSGMNRDQIEDLLNRSV